MTTRIGLILTYDNAIDAELWRWCPPDVSLHITRIGYVEWRDEVLDNERLADPRVVAYAVGGLKYIDPVVTVFACTSGSFARGLEGESRIRETMVAAGAMKALTTSGSVVDALRSLGVRRVAVGHPYSDVLGEILSRFLSEAGFLIASLVGQEPRPGETLNEFDTAEVIALAERAYTPDAEAIFLSCTALETLEAIPVLERRFGIPVVSAVSATMWAALREAGVDPSEAASGQRLFEMKSAGSRP